MLILLMLASTQLILLTSLDYTELELGPDSRSSSIDNTQVATIEVGLDHACAIGTAGQMKCWGDGTNGKTGHENTDDYGDQSEEMGQYLMFTDGGDGLTFDDVSAGNRFTCGLMSDASVKCWGSNEFLGSNAGVAGSGSLGDGYLEMGEGLQKVNLGDWNATSIAAGGSHACAIVNNGSADSLACWGNNDFGELGVGNTHNAYGNVQIGHVDLPERGSDLSQVALGSRHSCLLWSDGEIGCWGSNSFGQLGIGSTEDIGDEAGEMGSSMTLVDLPSDRTATQISAGHNTTCAILDNGRLSCWGFGSYGMLGSEGTNHLGDSADEVGEDMHILELGEYPNGTPLLVEDISVGHHHACAITDGGSNANQMKCWGSGIGGALGSENQDNLGDGQFEMGILLPFLDLGTGIQPISVEAGESFTCALMNTTEVKCWGSGLDGRTGQGVSGQLGDLPGDMGDNLPFVELYLPEETFDQPCDLPAEGSPLSISTVDSSTPRTGNKTATALTPESCGAIAYFDESDNLLKFGIFTKGRWATEVVRDYDSIWNNLHDVSITIGSDGVPHIVSSGSLNTNSGQAHYYTKKDGGWTGANQYASTSGVGDAGIFAVGLEIDGSGDIYAIAQKSYTTAWGSHSVIDAYRCTAVGHANNSCTDRWDGGFDLNNNYIGRISEASWSASLDTDVDSDGTVYVAYLGDADSFGEESGSVEVVELDSTGFGTPMDVGGTLSRTTANSSLSMDLGPDGSFHLAYPNHGGGLNYSICSSSCDLPASWSTEYVNQSVAVSDTGVIDISVGPDMSVVILAGASEGTSALHKTDGSWEKTELETSGGADWTGVEITDQGMMWAYAYFPNTGSTLSLYKQEGMTSPGLGSDIDGDGWSRLEELRCGTDYTNSSSTPADADGDGVCDLFDDWEDTSVSAESDALAIGEEFGCAVLSNRSVACWGDNSEGQLGSPSAGSSSAYAVMVDLPAGFEAGAVDAGSAHACSTGLDGKLVCWGRNTDGQLGRGNSSPSESPGYVNLPSGVTVSQFAAGADHNCMTGTDSNMYCWGNGSDDRTGKIVNSDNTVIQYENFTDDSRSWTSTSPTYLLGPGQGTDYIDKVYYSWWLYPQIYSDQSFDVTAGDVISFKMRGRNHGDNGYTSEVVKFYAGSSLLAQIDSNTTTQYSYWSGWQDVSFTVPDSYTGTGATSIKIEIWGYRNYVQIDDLRVKSLAYGSIGSVLEPSMVRWDESGGVNQISLGARHSCALMSSGSVNCWGYNGGSYANILGSPSYKGESTYDPKEVDLSGTSSLAASNWTSSTVEGINAGDGVTCAIMRSTEALCWGSSTQTTYADPVVSTIASTGDVGRSPALTTDGSGNWLLAYNDAGGISYARYDGSTWSTYSACASSDACDSTHGVGVGEDSLGDLHFLSYNEAGEQLMHTRTPRNITTTAAVTGEESRFFSISRDPSTEDLHLTYQQMSGRKLMHTIFNGTSWSTPTVIDDTDDRTGESYNGMKIDSSGNLHLSYWDWNTGGTDDTWLKYAYYNGTSWSVETLQSIMDQNNPTLHTSLDIDSSGNPHISYYDHKNDTLRYTYHNGTAWVDQTLTLDDSNDNGRFNSIALDSSDHPRIAYRNETSDDLELATWDGTEWTREVVDSLNNVGSWASIAIDSSDLSRIAYYYDYHSDLRYASHDGSAWSFEDIDTSVKTSRIVLDLDDSDRPRIAYKDWDNEPWLAYNNSGTEGTWETVQVRNGYDLGGHMAMTLDYSTGTAYMAYRQYQWPAYAGLVSSVYTGTVLATDPVSDSGEAANSVGMGPEIHIAGTTVLAPFMNGTDGESPAYVEMATIRAPGPTITSVDGESHYVGTYGISMALDQAGNQHISYYNASASSLMYARFDGSSWQVEEVDNGGASGTYSSIAIDPSGNPHISYVNTTPNPDAVMYAHHNGTAWTIEVIDATPYYAYDTSIDLDSSGSAHITYQVYNNSCGTCYNLRYSYHNGSEWVYEDIKDYSSNWAYSNTGRNNQIKLNSTDVPHVVFFDDYYDDVYLSVRVNGSWSSSSVDDYGGIYTIYGERAISLAIDSTDGLHVAYYDLGGRFLEYAHRGPGESSWTKTNVHDQGNHYIGTSVSIALDSADRPHIAYHDRTHWDLEYARFDGSEWLVETLDEYGNSGRYPSIALDGNDQVHIAYENSSSTRLMSIVIADGLAATEKVAQVGTHGYGMGFVVGASGGMHLSFYNGSDSSGSLQYATKSGSTWNSVTVDDGSTMVGTHSDIALDGSDNPHISYVDSTNGLLRYAYHNGESWALSTVDPSGSVLGRTSIAVDADGNPRIAYHDGTLRLAEWDGVSWTLTTQDPGSTGQGTQIAVDANGKTRIAYFDEDNDDLSFSLAGHQSPAVMGNSQSHPTGSAMGSGASGLASLDLGETHGCAVSSSSVICWGVATDGQLGNGASALTSRDPVSVTTVTGWTPLEVSVSTSSGIGGGTSCALYSSDSTGERRVMCWGGGGSGQIGDGGTSSLSSPASTDLVMLDSTTPLGASDGSETLSSSPYDVVEVSLSEIGKFGCARSSQGHVKCWGYNAYGQLGHGNTSTASDGENEMGEDLAFVPLGANRTATRISVGENHACGLLDDGSVKCWGRNNYGQLGMGNTTQIGDGPNEMGDFLAAVDLGTSRTATEIATGQHHSCALLDDGSVKCWGLNSYGQLGIGNTSTRGDGANEMGDDLVAVDLGTGRTAISIEAGATFTCAILDSGVLKCWGQNSFGQLGQGHNENIGHGPDLDGNGISCHPAVNSPDNTRECNARLGDGLAAVDLGDGRTAVSVSAGYSSTCAILDNGSVRCWGHNQYGRTGLGTTPGNTGDEDGEMGDNLATVELGTGRTASSISVGYSHACALLDNLSIACWGHNGQGQIGIGTNNDVDTTAEMGAGLVTADLPTTRSSSVSSGWYYSCAIIQDGTVRCWGENSDGRLGVYDGVDDDIGDESGEMGSEMQITNLYMVPPDFDGDGWIDLWDSDDDNDGYLDTDDDLPFDERDWFDHDGDGLGINVDTDDDDPSVKTAEEDTAEKWSDAEEEACGTLWWSSLSEPSDYDGDGICDEVDDDVDGNGWNDSYQCECSGLEDSDDWNRESLFGYNTGLTSFSSDQGQYGYDFELSEHGVRYYSSYYNDAAYVWLQRHDSSTYGAQSFGAWDDFNYWGIESQNGFTYLAYQEGVWRFSDTNGSVAASGTGMSHSQTTSSDIAISMDGDMVVRWHESDSGGTIRGAYLNGTTFQANAPGGLAPPDTGGNNQHGQIAFGPDGRLHVLMVNNSSGVIGFYHFYADLGSDLSGDVSLSWSTPELLLERNQSTGWSSGASHSATEDHSAELHYSSDGKMYAGMYNTTDLWLSTHDGSSWTTELVAESTGKNEGVEIATNSTGVVHVAWINHSSGQLVLSHKSSGSWSHEEVWLSDGWPTSTSTQTLNWARLTLKFDRLDDPYILSLDANDSSSASALLHYKGSLLDPSYTYQPADANGDGVCDTLQYAVMEYDTTELIVTSGESVSMIPTFSGQELVEVWAPSLPDGLSVNNTTGVISGAPTTVDTAGTAYVIYSNSSSASYPFTITFTVRTHAPMHAGYGSWQDHKYLSTSNGRGYTLHEYDASGNLYYYGIYQTSSAWTADGLSVSIGNGDHYVAKRWANGTWAWVVPIDTSYGGSPGALSVDGSGNSYVAGMRANGALDLPGTDHDLPSREAAYFFSLDTNGSTRWSQDAYIDGSSSANWHVSTSASIGNYGSTRMSYNESNGELTVAGQVSTSSISERTVSLGNLTMEIPITNYNYYRPFVIRINSTGEFSWATTVTPSSTYHRSLQGMGVHADGSVDILMQTHGETQLGDLTAGNESRHYLVARVNDTGSWVAATEITELAMDVGTGFRSGYDSAMMEITPSGELIVAIWSIDDISNLSVNGTSTLFNETCQDSLVMVSLSGSEWNVEASREFCLAAQGSRYGEYYSILEIDNRGLPVLFLGQRDNYQANHHRIIRLDSNLNPEFEEFITYANNPANSFLLDWEDVAFDPLGNMLVNFYSNQCSLYWNGSYMGRPSTYCNYNSQFFMEAVGHTIGGSSLVAGEPSTLWGVMGLSAMGATCSQGTSYCDEYLDSWASSSLPGGLSIDSDTGMISGEAASNMSESSFTLWMNDTVLGSNQLNVSFSILNGRPTVSYNETSFVLERGTEIEPISPYEVEGNILNWTFVPDLPPGLQLGASNGTVWGTPTVNLTQQTFQLRVTSDGGTTRVNFDFTINEPIANISYGNGTYIIPRDALVDIAPTIVGGAVASFAINSTSFPLGLTFNTTNGHFEGIPLLVTNQTTYTVTASNSGGTSSTEVTLWIVGNGIFLSFPTSNLMLTEGVAMQPIAGQTSGSTPESWEISPGLPDGLLFGDENGTVWGTPENVQNQTNYTIWANASGAQTSSVVITITVLVDTDGDSIADLYDDDDDDDGWNDTAELDCGTEPLNSTSTPADTDSDGICDTLDDSDDRAIALAYSVNSLDLVVNISVVDLAPITSGGTISSWEAGSGLPSGINLDNSTGVISGTPTEVFNSTSYVIWANNSAFSASFSINISSSLLDTDGDGIPDETDTDDDNDGWDDANETACSTDPLEEDDYPEDGDGDGICDANDPADDSPVLLAYPDPLLNLTTNMSIVQIHPIVFGGDVVSWEVSPDLPPGLVLDNSTGYLSGTPSIEFELTNYTIWANNSLHGSHFTIGISSWLLDSDGDGDPDETDPDDDNDGWGDEEEGDCLTSTLDPTSFPEDGDGDGLCDGLDQVDDSEIFLVYSMTSQLLFVNEPIEPIVGTTYGGDVRTWEVWPELPEGLTLNGALSRTTPVNGTISGAPMGEFEMQVFTVWANNSQYHSSVEITLQSVLPDPDDDDIDLIYLDDFLNLTTNVDEVYLEPQIFGGNVTSWSISPSAPDGLDFNNTNGLLTGTIAVEQNETVYTITGSNSLFLDTFQITIVARYLDTDEDGLPDLFDPDDDGDGWNDTFEIACGTDPLYIVESPEDHDEDWICDPLDEFDDSPIVFFYPNDKLTLTVGEEMEPLEPLIAPNSGGILLFTVIPDLPKGLLLDNSTGVISGTPEEAFRHMLIEYSHRFTAQNSQWDFSYRVDFDVFWPEDNTTDEDGDGWPDLIELECNTDPTDPSSFPEDIDLDGVCSYIDEDDDGDNIGDPIDRFPKDPTAWDDTDNDTMPDELTCKYLTDSANCTFELVEDLDDDNDGWLDLNETSCGTNPKDNLSVPEDDDGDGVCNLLEVYVPDAVRILWICCFPILLLLLLLLWVINPFTVREEEILGPEPEYTTTEFGWQGGTGEYDDPYVLMPVKGIRKGSFARSHEIIQVSNITPRLDCDFTDMSSEENGTRFSMKSKKANSRGNLEFRLEFSDNGETTETTEYVGLIRLGKATVYFQWAVEVEVYRDTPEEEIAKKRARRIEREAKRRASEMEKEVEERVAKAEIDAKKKAAEMQKDLKAKVAEVEKEAQERAAAAEEAAKKAEEAQKEAERKQAEAESEARRKDSERLEREAREKRLEEEERARIEAEEAAEEERKAEEEAAELRAMLRKKAEQRKAEEEERKAEEEAAKRAAEEEAARIEREAQERADQLQREAQERAAMVEREAARKAAEVEREAEIKAMEAKEKLRKRAIERKRQMDLEEKENQVARDKAAERFSAMEKELEDRRSKIEELDAEAMKKEKALIRVAEKSKDIDFGILGFATADQKDPLQEIKGIGPFIEEKLNALGIYTFAQISRMNSDLEDKINEAIEFFPGRIKRDEWAKQARSMVDKEDTGDFSSEDPDSADISQNELIEKARGEVRRKEEEEEKRREIERRKERAAELLSRVTSERVIEREEEDDAGIDFTVIGFGSEEDRDNLQQIDGIGRFVEKKLNGIGIYKISQIASMTQEISEEVNQAIGLGPGRIDRDEWVLQAKRLIR